MSKMSSCGAFAVLLGLVVAPFATAQDQAAIDKAMAGGVRYLKQSQAASGLWLPFASPGSPPTVNDFGATALAGIALLECGVPKNDAGVQAAANAVRRGAGEFNTTYTISVVIVFLDRLGDPRDAELIRVLSVRLVGGQSAAGWWSYECPIFTPQQHQQLLNQLNANRKNAVLRIANPAQPGGNPPPRPNPPPQPQPVANPPPVPADAGQAFGDNSNTQFAIIALWVARRHGVPVESALANVDKHFRNSQGQDGGWPYGTGNSGEMSSLSMTCAGLIGLGISNGMIRDVRQAVLKAGGPDKDKDPPKKDDPPKPPAAALPDPEKDKAVVNARSVVARAIAKGQPDENAGTGFPAFGLSSEPLYTLWSIERVAVAYGWRTIDNQDWYAWGCRAIVANQQQDGSWAATYPAQIDTAFALLFLRKSNLLADLTKNLRGEAILRAGSGNPDDPKTPDPKTPDPKTPDPMRPPVDPVKPIVEPKPMTSPMPTPEPSDPAQVQADRLAAQLVTATPARQQEILLRLQEEKGGQYSLALAEAIPELKGTARNDARDVLAQRLSRMNARTLREYFSHEYVELRRAAAWAAAIKDAKEHVPDLIELFADGDAGVASTAHEALKTLAGKDLGKSADKWKAWWQSLK